MTPSDKKPESPGQQSLASLAVVSAAWTHRMANTLGVVPIQIEYIRQHLDDAENVLEQLDWIERSVKELLRIGQELGGLSRFSTGSGVGPVAVDSVIERTIEEHFKKLVSANSALRIQLHLARDLPDVTADESLLSEAIRNVVDNSVQAIGEFNDGLIQIRTHRMHDRVAIDIADNGPGVSSSLVPHLFEAFFTTKMDKGLGMGLYLSRALVESWGGNLDLITSDSTGTTFRVTLTLWKTPVSVSSAKRALVVDDNRSWRETLRHMLLQSELVVDVAASFQDAINFVEAYEYDLALLDVRLEDMNAGDMSGLLIARLLRERNPEVLILVLTGYGTVPIFREAFKAGVDDVLLKGDDLIGELIRRVLDKVTVRRETERESIRQSQMDKLMYEVLGTISHELRTPLITILRNAEALGLGAIGPLTPAQHDAVAAIMSAARRESALLNAHLDLNRIQSGMEQLVYEEHDFVALVREEVLAHKQEADSRRINLKADLPTEQAIVKIDANRFRVALNPLMENAIKFSPDGGEVTILVTSTADYVEVLVSDQGPGIKPAKLDQMLNWRTFGGMDFAQRVPSSGLGLRMAKRIIELNGGRLWVESDGKNGTTVGFRLPVRK